MDYYDAYKASLSVWTDQVRSLSRKLQEACRKCALLIDDFQRRYPNGRALKLSGNPNAKLIAYALLRKAFMIGEALWRQFELGNREATLVLARTLLEIYALAVALEEGGEGQAEAWLEALLEERKQKPSRISEIPKAGTYLDAAKSKVSKDFGHWWSKLSTYAHPTFGTLLDETFSEKLTAAGYENLDLCGVTFGWDAAEMQDLYRTVCPLLVETLAVITQVITSPERDSPSKISSEGFNNG